MKNNHCNSIPDASSPCRRRFTRQATAALALALGLAASGCVEEPEAPLDEAAPRFELDDLRAEPEPAAAPGFQLPFPCGELWRGETRVDHKPQKAIDFNRDGDLGAPVIAAAAGVVTRAEDDGNSGYGRWVELDHGGDHRTRYGHLQTMAVSVGQSVSQGQTLGTVGSTGDSTGPHLHYEQRFGGKAVEPVFAGVPAHFYGLQEYTSANCDDGGPGIIGTVSTGGFPLRVRAAPSTGAALVGELPDGAQVTILCQTRGEMVKDGNWGPTDLWDFIGQGYVSDGFVFTGANGQVAPECP